MKSKAKDVVTPDRKRLAVLEEALKQIHVRLGQHYGIDANGVEVECYEIADKALKSKP